MKRDAKVDHRIAEVYNGSSFFTAHSGHGDRNVHRWTIGGRHA
jgi:hypothetical protein